MVFLIIFLVVALAAGILYLLARSILRKAFGSRQEGAPGVKYFHAEDFPGLNAEPVSFASDKARLRGYWYSCYSDCRGIVIFVHGMGGGHTAYTTEINALARAGYRVLAYDNTGTMLSDGPELYGLNQALSDLSAAYDFAWSANRAWQLPITLVGHSWGAFTVCNFIELRKSVAGIVALSPFESVPDVMVELVRRETGKNLRFLKPFFLLCNVIDYGRAALYRPSYSLQKASCPVLLMHGDADTMVPLSLSPLAYKDFFMGNPHITVQLLPGKGHNVYVTERAEREMQRFFAELTALNARYDGQPPRGVREEFTASADFRAMTEEDPTVMRQIEEFLYEATRPQDGSASG